MSLPMRVLEQESDSVSAQERTRAGCRDHRKSDASARVTALLSCKTIQVTESNGNALCTLTRGEQPRRERCRDLIELGMAGKETD